MNGKIVEALTKILEVLDENYSFDKVTSELTMNNDFDEQTVSAAYSIVLEKLLSNKKNIENTFEFKKKFRILTNDEINEIGIENYKYIQHLVNIGLLNPVEVELLTAHIQSLPDEKISKDYINWIILFSLVELDSAVLPGSRVLLHSSDTIN